MDNLKEQLMVYSCNDCDGDGIKYCPYKKEDSHDKYCQRPKTFAEDMLRIFEYNNYYPIRADSEGLVSCLEMSKIYQQNKNACDSGILVAMQVAAKAQKAICDKEKEEAVKKVFDWIDKNVGDSYEMRLPAGTYEAFKKQTLE